MFCKNCGKDIGTQTECSFCGYNPAIDNRALGNPNVKLEVRLPETKIIPLKKSNGMATAGFIMSFFSWMPPFLMLSYLFTFIGTTRCKAFHSGTGMCVVSWLFNLFWTAVYGVAIYLSYTGQLNM